MVKMSVRISCEQTGSGLSECTRGAFLYGRSEIEHAQGDRVGCGGVWGIYGVVNDRADSAGEVLGEEAARVRGLFVAEAVGW